MLCAPRPRAGCAGAAEKALEYAQRQRRATVDQVGVAQLDLQVRIIGRERQQALAGTPARPRSFSR